MNITYIIGISPFALYLNVYMVTVYAVLHSVVCLSSIYLTLTIFIFLLIEYPWPQCMVEATGFTVSGLRKCCLAIYDECLSNKNLVTDHRKIKLEAVANRYM